MTPSGERRLHLILTLVWLVLVVPSILWWRESIVWVVAMSHYACIAAHWGAYQAAKADEHVDQAHA